MGTKPGRPNAICADGFAPGPVAFSVHLPDGRVRPLPGRGDSADLILGALDPTGTYVVTAAQGPRTATAAVIATLPTEPVIETLEPGSAAPGTTFQFGVASPEPQQVVELDVYVYSDGKGRGTYLTSLVAARTDGSGRIRYQLPTLRNDPPGRYSVNVRGDVGVGAPFTVR